MASKAIGFLNFKFGADLSGFERAMNKAQKKLKKFGNQLQKTGKSMTMGLTLPIVGFGIASLKAFDAQQKAIAQVEAGLKSTGNMVGFTSEQLQKMAADLQTKTLFGDEEILQGATAQLLTFTNIAGEQFERTQVMVLDLATRLDGDLKSASIMLGKALNDPIANLSALSRAGIQFSEDQKATIKSLVETNSLADAQTIILEELEKQYGGSAEAAAKAGMGPLKQLMNQLSDLSEQIGMRLIPFVKGFAEWILKLAKKFDGLSESTKDNIVKWGLILAAIGPVLIIIGKVSVGVNVLIGGFKKLSVLLVANPWVVVAAAIAGVAYALYDTFIATEKVAGAQDVLNETRRSAELAIMDQKVEVKLLTAELTAQGLSLDDKRDALKKLQVISPQYYGSLDAATLTVESLDKATQGYTSSLLIQARAESTKQKIIDLNVELMDREEKARELAQEQENAWYGRHKLIINARSLENIGEIANIHTKIQVLGKEYEAIIKNINAKEKESKTQDGKEEEIAANQHLLDTIAKLEAKNRALNKTDNDKIEKLKLSQILTKDYAETITGLGEKISDLTHVYNNAEKGTDDFNKSSELLLKTQEDLKNITKVDDVEIATFESSIGELKKHHQLSFNAEKENLANRLITKEEFDKRIEEDELFHLLQMKQFALMYGEDIIGIDGQILDKRIAIQERLNSIVEDDPDPFANYRGSLGKLGDKITEFTDTDLSTLEDGFASIVESLAKELAQGAETFEEYGKNVLGVLKDIIGGMISVGVAAAVKHALSTLPTFPGSVFLIPLLAGAAAGLARTAFNSLIPEFAAGGLVTGPTTALIGEGSGTSMANPEVIAPLDKLRNYMGGGSNVTVTGRLVGNDIYLSNERTKFNRNRTV
jgi:uncharacterized protein YukE